MTDQLFRLRDLIHERTGLFFGDGAGMESLTNLLKPLMEKTGASPPAYYEFLDNEPPSGEWLNVIDALSKPVSSFLRRGKQVDVLASHVLPHLVGDGVAQPLGIWSAGCATGEEPLAVAMALSEAGLFDRADIEIRASDGSFTAIERARAGVYSPFRLRYLSPELRDKYFEPVDDGWLVNRELHGRIKWSVTNLMVEDDIMDLASSPVIFCRNVFIYFSEPAIRKTLCLFGKYMPTGGYLFTDEGDYFTALVSGIKLFEPVTIDSIPVWRKSNVAV